MERQGLTRKDLEPSIGRRTRVADVSTDVLMRPSCRDRAA
jgi:hypothetical protein